MDEMREKSGKEQQGEIEKIDLIEFLRSCLLYTSPSPRDRG